jgi:hypothetical protein
MRAIVAGITSGVFADDGDAEREAGHPRLAELKAAAMAPAILDFEADLRRRLGELAVPS